MNCEICGHPKADHDNDGCWHNAMSGVKCACDARELKAGPNVRHLFEVRITLPQYAITDEYIQRMIKVIEILRPNVKGQRCTVAYQGEVRR